MKNEYFFTLQEGYLYQNRSRVCNFEQLQVFINSAEEAELTKLLENKNTSKGIEAIRQFVSKHNKPQKLKPIPTKQDLINWMYHNKKFPIGEFKIDNTIVETSIFYHAKEKVYKIDNKTFGYNTTIDKNTKKNRIEAIAEINIFKFKINLICNKDNIYNEFNNFQEVNCYLDKLGITLNENLSKIVAKNKYYKIDKNTSIKIDFILDK